MLSGDPAAAAAGVSPAAATGGGDALPPWADTTERDLSAAANKSPALIPLLVGWLLGLLAASGAESQSPEKLQPDSPPISVSWLTSRNAADEDDDDDEEFVGKKFCSRAGTPNKEDRAPVLLPRRSSPDRPPKDGTTDFRDDPRDEAADATASPATPASEPNPMPLLGVLPKV